jgi:hypothetical protein
LIVAAVLTLLSLIGVLALIPLGWRAGDKPHDARVMEVRPEPGFPVIRVRVTNPGDEPVVVGLSLRRPSLRLRLEGGHYVRLRTRQVTSDLLPGRQATVGVLAGRETGTFRVPAARGLDSRPELVTVLGQRGRLRTVHRALP